MPAGKDEPKDTDLEVGFALDEATPSAVRSAEGIPFPTRPGPDQDEE
jgi:D-aminopeptidase